MSNDYWTGNTLASLTASQISAPWGRGDYCGRRIGFANELFQFWYDARANIAACTNAAHKSAMTTQLEDAGKTGSGFFIDDLEEAFQHIHDNSGRWTDDTSSLTYFGGPNKVFRRGDLISDMPKPFVKFADAVDSKFQVVRNGIENFGRQSQAIQTQLTSRNTDWARIGTALSEIKNGGDRLKPFLWTRPRSSRAVATTTSFADALNNIHSGVTTYTNARRAHFPRGASVAIGAMRTAVGFVPVLGNYYGGLVDLIPNLNNWFTNVIRQRVERIDRLLAGRP